MSDTNPGDNHLHRLILFSDAVFAIAITLLAIEIHPPEHWHGAAELLALMAPKLASYAVSFAVVGIYWVSHRRIFAKLDRADGVLDILNFVVLGLIALLPLATELLWEQVAGQAYPIYVAMVATIGLALAVLWGYAAFIGRLAKPVSRAEAVFVLVRVALLPGLMCGLSFFSIAFPWGWAIMGLLIVSVSFAGRWIAKLPPPAPRAPVDA